MRRPVNSPYTITTEFGIPDSNAFFGYHSGVDYGVARNTPIYAPTAGKIVYLTLHSTGGNMVIIFDGQFYHRLMHNTSFASGLQVNSQVTEGQVVAYAGDTGLAFGVHCHWDISDEIISPATPRPSSFAHFKDPAKWLAGEYNVTQGVIMDTNDGIAKYRTSLFREPESTAAASQWNGMKPSVADDKLRTTPEWQANAAKLKAYDALQSQVAELSSRPTKAELEAVIQTANQERDKIAVLETALAEEKAKPPVTIEVTHEVTKEVEVVKNPTWLNKVIDFINNLLRSK